MKDEKYVNPFATDELTNPGVNINTSRKRTLAKLKRTKQETADLIDTANNSARISLNGSIDEKKAQLLKALKDI